SCLQNGNPAGSLPDSERKRRGSRNRWSHVRSYRRKRSGVFSGTDPERTSQQHVSTHAGTEEGNTERGEPHENAVFLDFFDPRPGGPGSLKAHPGADLRGRLPTGIVWIPTEADRS